MQAVWLQKYCGVLQKSCSGKRRHAGENGSKLPAKRSHPGGKVYDVNTKAALGKVH